jgi:hypothetical protein
MTEKEAKKHIVATVPAILTGTAALIAALTTTYVSLRDGKPQMPEKAQITAVAQPVENPSKTAVPAIVPPAVVPTERPVVLQVERIAVHSDGTAGTTDWRFAVEVDDEPRFTFEQTRLTDEGGRNIAMPEDATTTLRLAVGKPAKITVKGWRYSALHAATAVPDAQGEGQLGADGKPEPIQVSAAEPDKGAFTFYFSADAQPSGGASQASAGAVAADTR